MASFTNPILGTQLAPIIPLRVNVVNPPKLKPGEIALPRFTFSEGFHTADQLIYKATSSSFSINMLAALFDVFPDGFRHHAAEAKRYLDAYTLQTVAPRLTTELVNAEWPIIFFPIARGDISMVRQLLQIGGAKMANMQTSSKRIPVLGYAIIFAGQTGRNTLPMVQTLLAYGAEPRVIHADYWRLFYPDPAFANNENYRQYGHLSDWCRPEHHGLLDKGFSSPMRHFLYEAASRSHIYLDPMLGHESRQLRGLVELQFCLVGQSYATKPTMDQMMHYTRRQLKPLVLFFTGASASGRTTLARRAATAMDVEDCIIDCKALKLNDPAQPPSEKHSKLCNFLMANSGKRCIIVLDKFENLPDAFLPMLCFLWQKPKSFQKGRFLDLTHAIFILETNAASDDIIDWHKQNQHMTAAQFSAAVVKLQISMLKALKDEFGREFAVLVDAVIPFFPTVREEDKIAIAQMQHDAYWARW